MRARDIMTASVVTVGPDAGVDDIARLLLPRTRRESRKFVTTSSCRPRPFGPLVGVSEPWH
jgi:CBS domain-containing protein